MEHLPVILPCAVDIILFNIVQNTDRGILKRETRVILKTLNRNCSAMLLDLPASCRRTTVFLDKFLRD